MNTGSGVRLLLVEDDPSFSESLIPRLARRGYSVDLAVTGEEGVKMMARGKYNAVIADIKLPEMSGIQFLARVREYDDELPVLLLTGYESLDTAKEAVKLNAQDYLLKPLKSLDDLLEPMQKAIVTRALKEENLKLQHELTEISENEKRRMGRDLHDDLCQELTGIALLSKNLEQDLRPGNPQEAGVAGEIAELLGKAVDRARSIAAGLCPVRLETEGFAAALRELALNSERIFGIECSVRVPNNLPVTDEFLATHLYRIIQESVSNAAKHGMSDKVVISATTAGEELVVSVSNNGRAEKGLLNARDTRMGSHIMRYRARLIGAVCSMKELPEGGSMLTCTVRMHKE